MNLFLKNLNFNKENILYNIPDGVDCFAVFELLKHFNNTLVILRDDVRLERFSKSLEIIDNKINIIEFPAWDCLPFDKNSPNQKIIGRRVKALFNLLNLNNKKTFVCRLVGIDETNIEENWINVDSPLGKSLIGRSCSDVVKIKTKIAETEYKVINFWY